MFLAAIDPRVTLSVPVVMMASHFYGGCPCESGLPIHFIPGHYNSNNAEFGAMVAPSPQLVISDGGDWTKSLPEIELPYLKKVYGYYGAAEKVCNAHFAEEGHDYGYSKRAAMYAFVAEHFKLNDKPFRKANGAYDESGVTIEPAAAMFCFGSQQKLPDNAITGLDALARVIKENQKTVD